MVDNSVGGEISSDRAFTLAANTLNNQGGRLISSEALTLRIAKALDNSLKGQVLATDGLAIESQVLDNRAGTIGSKGDARISVTSLDNAEQGSLVSEGRLELVADQVSNGNQGRIAARGVLEAAVGTLLQQGGELVSQGAWTFAPTRSTTASPG